MKNRITAAVLSLILVFSLSACSLSPGAPVHSDEILPASTNEAVITPSPSATNEVVNTPSPAPTPAVTPEPAVLVSPDASDDITAQDICVLAYFDALKINDADKIIQISSSSMLGDTYSNMMGSDSIGEFFSMAATSDLMKGTWYFIYSILSDYPPGITSPDISKETIDEFIQEVDPARLADIKVLSLGTPLEKPELPSNFQINTGILTQRYCLFSVGNNLFCQLFWLFRSNDGYNIFALGDNNGYSFDGVAKPVEPDGFKALIDPLSQNKPSADTIASSAGIMDKTTYLQKMKDMYSLSFSTPNDSINFFAEALAKRNIYDILRAFDIKEEAEYFDLYKATEWFKAFSPYGAYCMTNEYDFYRDINLALNCSKAAEGIISLLFSLSFDFDLEAQYTTLEYFSAIKNSFDTINSFSVIRNDVFASKDGRLHEILLEQAAAIGADNMEHRIIEYKFNGKKFTGAITLINYDGDWSIKELTSPLINLPAQLPIAPSDKLDYNSYI